MTVAHAPTSGAMFLEVNDADTILELQSGAPLGGPGNQGLVNSPYTLQFNAGYLFCEGTTGCPCPGPIASIAETTSAVGYVMPRNSAAPICVAPVK